MKKTALQSGLKKNHKLIINNGQSFGNGKNQKTEIPKEIDTFDLSGM
jgi:hypothetical protein